MLAKNYYEWGGNEFQNAGREVKLILQKLYKKETMALESHDQDSEATCIFTIRT